MDPRAEKVHWFLFASDSDMESWFAEIVKTLPKPNPPPDQPAGAPGAPATAPPQYPGPPPPANSNTYGTSFHLVNAMVKLVFSSSSTLSSSTSSSGRLPARWFAFWRILSTDPATDRGWWRLRTWPYRWRSLWWRWLRRCSSRTDDR